MAVVRTFSFSWQESTGCQQYYRGACKEDNAGMDRLVEGETGADIAGEEEGAKSEAAERCRCQSGMCTCSHQEAGSIAPEGERLGFVH